MNILSYVRASIKKQLSKEIDLSAQGFKCGERNPNDIQISVFLFTSSSIRIDNAAHVKSRGLFPMNISIFFIFIIIFLPIRTFNYVFLLNLAVRDNPVNVMVRFTVGMRS